MRTFDELLDCLESRSRWNDPIEIESAKKTLRAMMAEAVAAERERKVELREAARAFYNATVAQPGMRLTTADKSMRDETEAAGERLRALLVASGPNVGAKRGGTACRDDSA